MPTGSAMSPARWRPEGLLRTSLQANAAVLVTFGYPAPVIFQARPFFPNRLGRCEQIDFVFGSESRYDLEFCPNAKPRQQRQFGGARTPLARRRRRSIVIKPPLVDFDDDYVTARMKSPPSDILTISTGVLRRRLCLHPSLPVNQIWFFILSE